MAVNHSAPPTQYTVTLPPGVLVTDTILMPDRVRLPYTRSVALSNALWNLPGFTSAVWPLV